jgi:formamidopyrimidine-DNA glycosylase
MPELPEVETIRTQLAKHLIGHKILGVEVSSLKTFSQGREKLIGGKVKSARRLGKVLIIDLDNGFSFLIHLKLTGQVVYASTRFPNQPNKFTRVTFNLDKDGKLFFNDSRKFGWVRVEETTKVAEESFISRLGPEPLRDLTGKEFTRILFSSRRPVKVILMDQEKISGVGNIYANDALWLAKIDPKRAANTLTAKETQILYTAVIKVLKDGIKYEGASDQWYVTAEGKKGSYQDHFLAYGKKDELCPRCRKGKFSKFYVGGRGTYVCPVCQK